MVYWGTGETRGMLCQQVRQAKSPKISSCFLVLHLYLGIWRFVVIARASGRPETVWLGILISNCNLFCPYDDPICPPPLMFR